LPARLTAIADEVRTLKERIRQLETERNEKRIRLESCGALLRELEAAKSANRRVFPEGGE
jgi:cell division septum initiation protein DivIVA